MDISFDEKEFFEISKRDTSQSSYDNKGTSSRIFKHLIWALEHHVGKIGAGILLPVAKLVLRCAYGYKVKLKFRDLKAIRADGTVRFLIDVDGSIHKADAQKLLEVIFK